MNEIANKFLLAGDKCVPGIHLKQSGFVYSGFGQLTKNKERIQKIKKKKTKKKQQEIQYIFTEMKQIKLVFNMTRLRKILKIQEDEELHSGINDVIKQNEQLAQDLHKPIITNF